ncbi:HpcH/HpaI aldolase family protein [Ramlibacter algicola]|uniref:HpcH/HpaI aldolase/citrate lyase family protein n=1 Tax=Ramlibacter algicola TaxID=2795217 RepID=A0A934UPE1_9BURK|nr:HpcH/HpaI aldolase/citrate lyase family protein [Ramlibacter algicola]MBK0391449.1 HpcH/HpaI aldolase/citrate lyase family protein [Ramlibacter algicola]
MQTPINPFKQAMREKRVQYGLWSSMLAPIPTEIAAAAGFDWLLLDGEHSPNSPLNLLQQAQVVAGYPGTHAIARIPMGHGWMGQAFIKQVLDVGIQTLLVPMVETAEQARELVRCMRYAPAGIRGMAGVRASGWGRNVNYGKEANDQVCLLVQAETRAAIENLDAIAAVDGVDGVFIGPADLSAAYDHVGDPWHPEMLKIHEDAFRRIQKAGKAVGILTLEEDRAKQHVQMGATFIAVGTDTNLLVKGTNALVKAFKGTAQATSKGNY